MELILVLVLVSITLALAAPSMKGFVRGRQTTDAATRILAMTHYARAQAVAQGRPFRLHVSGEQNACWLTAQRGGAFTEVDAEIAGRCTLPAGVSVQLALSDELSATGQATGLRNSELSRAMTGLLGRPRSGAAAPGQVAGQSGIQDYIEFTPDGRAQAATITVTGPQGEQVRVMCESATERYKIARGGEGTES